MESRLLKLDEFDKIEIDIGKIVKNVTLVEARISDIETQFSAVDSRLIELERSRQFNSDECTELKTNYTELSTKMSAQQHTFETIFKDFGKIRADNKSLSDEVVDLKARSMRNNLLFFNFDEEHTFDDRKYENCANKIHEFCEKDLAMPDARDNIRIDRAQRIGNYETDSKRPLVVRFNYYQEILTVKQKVMDPACKVDKRVSDQFPREIQERRKKFIP
ncbi:hypothetical protein DPMN_103237 [Dreissena polymorpha]|uniref:Uncharacterized protein n=1 Tax=Dreissena polymorpha TaxID=45954 RepID=A0A9D4H7I6_DREPO|nr:hypothetical protein DPMN_103237 [Dreissena polymorpha]